MGLVDTIITKAQRSKKHIVLPEGTEPRIIKAAAEIRDKEIAKVTLIGNPAEICTACDVDLSGIDIIDPTAAADYDEFCEIFFKLRESKGVTLEQAKALVADPVYYATMMVYKNKADGMVAGAVHSTGDTIRPALQTVKTAPGIKSVSSCFLMEVPDKSYGKDGVIAFGDCAIVIDPSAEELAGIAIATAKTAASLAGIDPCVAMLSFSTKGSAKHAFVDKVTAATKLVGQLEPTLKVDGELQADAALVESVGQLKSPGSAVAGHANVLIFPDLQSGNIGYKLVQRLAKAEAIGPVIQGIAKPINDLSRGCSVEDIVALVAITAVQAAGI